MLVIYIMMLNFAKLAFSDPLTNSQKESKGQALNDFANLLKNIIKVNEERVEAIRKITNLQDYMLTKNQMSLDDDYDDSVEELVEAPPALRRKGENETDILKRCVKLYKENKKQPYEIARICSQQGVHICNVLCRNKLHSNYKKNNLCTISIHFKIIKECQDKCKTELGKKYV
ncbi:uncharacterized protein LOC142984278 [Anticarsia gemmatalis]|uniref:uncharacterized protein LOC142984278 n=1 Tax=Anticarsia gemmatalis TaxID=129554 RepID=UPI003F761645